MSAKKRHDATYSHDMCAEEVGLMGKSLQYNVAATLGALAEAVTHLSALSETKILEVASTEKSRTCWH
jgi:hypothetical protein